MTGPTQRRVRLAPAAVLIASLGLGCGGKHADTTPSGGGGEARSEAASGDLVPPEKMDAITHNLDRKRPIVSRCLASAIDNKELPKNSSGKVTLEIVISPAGRADSVKVIRSTLDSKTLNECVINHVKEIEFPQLPKPYETSYTYGFEAS